MDNSQSNVRFRYLDVRDAKQSASLSFTGPKFWPVEAVYHLV